MKRSLVSPVTGGLEWAESNQYTAYVLLVCTTRTHTIGGRAPCETVEGDVHRRVEMDMDIPLAHQVRPLAAGASK